MSTIASLLCPFFQKDVRLWVHHGALHYSDPQGLLAPNEIDLIRNEPRKIVSELMRSPAWPEREACATPPLARDLSPLTFQQEFALRYLGQKFFVVYAARLCGTLNVCAISDSVSALVQRHEALRSRVVVTGGTLRQQVTEFDGYRLKVVAEYCCPTTDADNVVQRQIAEFADQWLATGEQAFDARLFRIAEDEHVLVVLWDHLFHDYVSGVRLNQELWMLYRAFDVGLPSPLSPKLMQYRDYTIWQRHEYPNWREKNREYWNARLRGATAVRLPIDRLGHQSKPYREAFSMLLGDKLSLALDELAHREKITLPMIWLAILCIAVSRWSGQQDFVIPYTFSGRYFPEHLDVMGFLPIVAPLRISLAGPEPLCAYLKRVSREFLSAIQHLRVGKTIDACMPDVLLGPLFQWFSSRPSLAASMQPPQSEWDEQAQRLAIRPFVVKWKGPEPDFPVELIFWKDLRGIVGSGEYRADLFSENTIQRFSRDLRLIAEHAVRDRSASVASLSA